MAMQLMAGAKVIDVNQAIKEDRALFGGAQKVRVRPITGDHNIVIT
ncbi:unnamed protein product [Laminaria digitata]